jgi:enoyl-CoA hydratase
VTVTQADGVCTVTLNRPQKLNAIDQEVADALVGALDAASGAGAIVLRGAGRAFCAGADLHAVGSAGADAHAAWIDRIAELHERVRHTPVPVVASVHGHALGAGLSLALVCDFVICAEDAVLALPEVEHGLVAGVSTV